MAKKGNKKTGRKINPITRLQALALLEANSMDFEKVSKDTGTPKSTLMLWHKEGVEKVDDVIEDLAEDGITTSMKLLEQIKEQVHGNNLDMLHKFQEAQEEALKRATALIRTSKSLRDVSGAMKIIGDSMFQMRGGQDKQAPITNVNADNAQINNFAARQAQDMLDRTTPEK